MASFNEYKRRVLLPVVGLGLAAYYLLVFEPLSRRAEGLDQPLQTAWRRLAAALEQTNATSLDFLHITNQLQETRQELTLLDSARKKAAARLELPPALRAQLVSPFQLVDFENERSRQIDELDKKAKQEKITVDPLVFAGYPDHTADISEPALLWPALSLTDGLVETALACKVSSLQSVEVSLALTNAPGADANPRWTEIPLEFEFTAPAENALKVIQSLPLRTEEIRDAGLPSAPPEKAPLFIERLILRKQTPDKLDEVRVWVRVIGFVARD